MRALFRLVRLVWTLITQTFYASVRVRLLPPAERAAYRAHRQQVGCAALCRILGINVCVEGQLPDGGAMLAVSNHFGVLDPIVLASQFPAAFVGKAELAHWPLIGWVTRTYGLIFVDRARRTSTGLFVEQVRETLRRGVRVFVFPEGTTFSGPEVQPFKTGAFEAVAGMEDAHVLPIYLAVVDANDNPANWEERDRLTWADSTQTFLQNAAGLLRLGRVYLRVCVGDPIPTAGLDRKMLAARSHGAVVELMEGVYDGATLSRPVSRGAGVR